MHDFSNQVIPNSTPSHGRDATFLEIASWIAVTALVVVLVLTYAWLQTERLQIKYRIQALAHEQGKLQETASQIKAEYSSLTNPESISRQATALGLIPSHQDQVIIVTAETPIAPVGLMADSKKNLRTRR